MATRFKQALVAAAALTLAGAYTVAAAPTSQRKNASNSSAWTLHTAADTVTGCLRKGSKSGEYTLAAADGKEYQLMSQSVPLSKHVGHQVTVTGSPGGMSAGRMATDTGSAKSMGGMTGETLDVTKVAMVSTKCSK